MSDITIIGGCRHVGLPLGLAFARAGKKIVALDNFSKYGRGRPQDRA